jgi:solute carrier family 41
MLSYGQHWKAMTRVNELIAIVPVILNLKGNIEMNLSARLGTASNMGDLDTPSIRNALILGNLALLQVQAAVVSFIAACFTFFLSTIIPGVGDEQPQPLPADTRDPFRHYLRIARQGHSLRRPLPTLPSTNAPKSGFYECVRVHDRRLPFLTCFVTQIHGAHVFGHVLRLHLRSSTWLVHVFPCRPLPKVGS